MRDTPSNLSDHKTWHVTSKQNQSQLNFFDTNRKIPENIVDLWFELRAQYVSESGSSFEKIENGTLQVAPAHNFELFDLFIRLSK